MSKSKNYSRYDFDDANYLEDELVYDKKKTDKFKRREQNRLEKLSDVIWDENDDNRKHYIS